MPSIEELKARLGKLNRSGKVKDVWKPTDEHVVRLLQYPHGTDPFIEIYFHYEVSDTGTVVCPKMNTGDECEICDFAEKLKSWKDDNGQDKAESDRKADWEIFKKIQAKARVFIPMVERGKEKEGAKFWGVTPNQAQEILAEALDSDRREECGISPNEDDTVALLQVLVNPKKAFDLAVSFAKPGEKGNNKSFPLTTIKGKIKPTPLSNDEKLVNEIVNGVKNIKDVYPITTSAEAAKILKRWAGNSGAEAPAEGGKEKYSGKEKEGDGKSHSKEKAANVGKRSIDQAFDDLAKESAKNKAEG